MNTVKGQVTNTPGYAMCDCGGLDLKRGDQNIPGLFKRANAAMGTGKEVIATNIFWDGHYISGISAMGIRFTGSLVVFTANTLQVFVDNSDNVTIANLAPEE